MLGRARMVSATCSSSAGHRARARPQSWRGDRHLCEQPPGRPRRSGGGRRQARHHHDGNHQGDRNAPDKQGRTRNAPFDRRTLNGQLTNAAKLAMDKGAQVAHAADIAQALAVLRSGRGADLLMVDVAVTSRPDRRAGGRAHPGAGRRLRHRHRRARRGRRHPGRREGIYPAAARCRADRRRAGRRRRRPADLIYRDRHGAVVKLTQQWPAATPRS